MIKQIESWLFRTGEKSLFQIALVVILPIIFFSAMACGIVFYYPHFAPAAMWVLSMSGFLLLFGLVFLIALWRGIKLLSKSNNEILNLNRQLKLRGVEMKLRSMEMEAANKELESFSYSVSHDLRAPLRHIDGFVELLHKSSASKLDEKGLRQLKVISDSAKEMGRLIDALLVFSRMGRVEMKKSLVNTNEIVKTVVSDLLPDIKNRKIEWKISDLPSTNGDASLIKQVFANLIQNAVKYSGARQQAVIEVGSKSGTDGNVIFFIRDNGAGFDMKYADKLFGVFQRLHRAEEFEGTGIGLANVRRIIQRHGGGTWAEGVVDGGATFSFSLPN